MSSAAFHLLFPDMAQGLLAEPIAIRGVGSCLVFLGVWALAGDTLISKFIGALVLLSGAARMLVPDYCISVNEWTSKYIHAVLLGLAALIVFGIAIWCSKRRLDS